MQQERGKSILWIEDDEAFVQSILRLWSPTAFLVRAATGKEALEALRQARPDLILLDLCLPHELAEVDEEEGIRLLHYIREEKRWDLPVVVLTRDVSNRVRERISADGASAFLVKPVEASVLTQVIERLIAEADRRADTDCSEETVHRPGPRT